MAANNQSFHRYMPQHNYNNDEDYFNPEDYEEYDEP